MSSSTSRDGPLSGMVPVVGGILPGKIRRILPERYNAGPMTEVAHLSRRKIKRMGAHYTPRELAAFLAERAAACLGYAYGRPIRVLAPACGDGSLLRAISEALAGRAVVLSGYDTDTIAVERARQKLPGTNIKLADFLMASGVRAADLVISNPPYVRTQALGA